jgi:hypothetical protein
VHDDEISDVCLRPPFDDLIRARDEIQKHDATRASEPNEGKKRGRPDVSRLGPLAALYFAAGCWDAIQTFLTRENPARPCSK